MQFKKLLFIVLVAVAFLVAYSAVKYVVREGYNDANITKAKDSADKK